jgi:O-antigen ligase
MVYRYRTGTDKQEYYPKASQGRAVNNFISKARFYTLGSAVALLPFSIAFCHLFLTMFLIVCLCEGNFNERRKAIAQNPLTWLLSVLFLLYVIGFIYSNNERTALSNIEKKLAFFVAPLIIASAIPFTKEEINKLTWVFVAACLAGTLACLVNSFFILKGGAWNLGPVEPYLELHPDAPAWWPYFSYIHLASGIGMHPTYFSLYLLICVLIVIRTIDKRWLSIALIAYMAVFIVMLSSRIVVLISVVTILVAVPRGKLLIAGVIIAALLLNPIALYRNTQEYTVSNFSLPPAPMSDNPISIRMSLWWLSAKAFGEINPVIGTGTGDVEGTISALADKYNAHNVLNTSDPHNQYIHTYIALGAAGLIMLVAVFAVPLLMLFQKREFWLCAGLIAFMVVCLTESVMERQKGIVLFSLFVGLTGNQLREFHFTSQRLKYA